jgi:hypothetical protein
MKGITPITILDSMITSSSVVEPAANETAWSATALYGDGDEAVVTTLTSNVTVSNGSPAVVTWTANNIGLGTPIIFSTTNALPAGLSLGVVYYLLSRLSANTFTVSATLWGPPVITSSAGAGTHTAVAYVHGVYQATVGATGAVTISNGANALVGWAGHGRSVNDAIAFTVSGGTLPTGITAGSTYYIISTGFTSDQFEFSVSLGGAAVTTSSAGSGTFTCGLASTYNKPPMLHPEVWDYIGMTNRMAMFDYGRNIASYGSSPLTVVITPGQRIDSIGMDDLVGTSVQVTATSVLGGGSVYNSGSISLVTRSAVNGYEYCFKPFTFRTRLSLFDLPPYTDIIVTTVVTNTAGTARVGAMVMGLNQYIGDAKFGAISDANNYSTVDRDPVTTLATLNAKRAVPENTLTLRLDKAKVEGVRQWRDANAGKMVFWAGVESSDDGWYGSFQLLGFWEQFSINAELPQNAAVQLRLQGL